MSMDPRFSSRTRFLLPVLLTTTALLTSGCGGDRAARGPGTAPNGAITSTDNYISQYTTRQYAEAKASAQAAAAKATGPERDRALLFQGMSAHALGQRDEAERVLEPLQNNPDRELAGRAGATLGLIAQERKLHERAAGLLSTASKKLSGDSAARAAMAAGDSLLELGRRADANEEYKAAARLALDPRVQRQVAERLEGKRFAVQIGVFAQRQNADKAAANARAKAATLGLTAPLITPRPGKSSQEFVVRIGPFNNRQAATEARTKLATGAVVMVD